MRQNAIVGAVAAITPSIEKTDAAETLRTAPNGFTIAFEGDRTARLDAADPRAHGYAEILEGVRRRKRPVYVEVDPATNAITRIHLPVVARVLDVAVNASGDVRVRLDRSHARPGIRRGSPDYDEILGELRDAKAKNEWVALTADGPNIIDVRPYKPPLDERVFEPPSLERWWQRFLWWRLWPWNWFRCVSARKAQALFDLCAATSCNPLTVPPPCIPFMYPEDGCWGRAHEMCRLMILDGAKPRKVWIDGSLNAKTKNSPYCEVFWGWHVAPTLCVRKWWFLWTQEQVIDPSLFAGPVSKATWKGVQGDPGATLTSTDASYFCSWIPADPTYTDTNIVLADYRAELQARSLGPDGPPPYAACP